MESATAGAPPGNCHRRASFSGDRTSARLPAYAPRTSGSSRPDQDYARIADDGRCQRYDYALPAFGFTCRLRYDESGLVLYYPGIAVRAA